MLKNYFTIALRNFWKNKVFSLINITGLAIGISAALVIYLIADYEFGYEKFQKDGNLIYRVVTDDSIPDYKNCGVPGPLPAVVRNEIPGIEKSAVFWQSNAMKVTAPSKIDSKNNFENQNSIIYADEEYFHLFQYKWLTGTPDNSLLGPNKVVLTESRAKTYFSYSDIRNAVGQTIIYDDSIKAIVTGIVKDLDEKTDFTFKEFISLPTFSKTLKKKYGWGEWGVVYSNTQFFIKLQKEADAKKIDLGIAQIRKSQNLSATGHFLEPLTDIHFNSEYDAFDHRQAHRPTLYGLLAIAAFLLLLGCINFVNLTTSQSIQRAKEIGLRKTMGSSKWQLVIQFLSETFLLTSLATFLSVLLVPLILKLFSDFIPPEIHFNLAHQPNIIEFTVILILVVTFFSGFYPALVLSGYKPVLALKNQIYINTNQSRTAWTRKVLTVAQFIIAQFFIIATLVVGKQIRYSLNKDLGYKKDAIINFSTPYIDHENKRSVLLEKIKEIPGIQQVSRSSRPPAVEGDGVATMPYRKNGELINITSEQILADTSYIDLYRIKLLAGRNFMGDDTKKGYIVNQAFVRLLGFTNPADVIGKSFSSNNNNDPIIGVIADFHTKSLHKPIQPLMIRYSEATITFNVALSPANGHTAAWKTIIAKLENVYKEIFPENNFSYSFFDESIARFYKKEQDTISLLKWSTGLTIFISCLGLLGLVIYTTTQKRKEIGVRKVLGASVTQIVTLLSKDLISLVLIAFLIAAPLSWLVMNKWLQDFAYRTNISWWVFAVCGISILVFAFIILGIRTVKAAIENPVKSLRTE